MHTLQQLHSGELKGHKHLKLSCQLSRFPDEIFSLADSLEVLDLSGNQLSSLPADFGKLSKLKIAFFSDNLFTELPEVLSDCRSLDMIGFKSNQIESVPENSLPETTRWLILTNNKISAIPRSIGKCRRLQKVAFAGNRLNGLPDDMAQCTNLELLRISANQFTQLPGWLLHMPKLAWLAVAGNPFSRLAQKVDAPDEFSWNEFELLEQLGEGASGNIYKARWNSNRTPPEVAIKVFKGEVTSDGFPADEMQACIAAGTHPNLVGLLGKIKDHPDGKQGLIMELIPKTYYNLGMPPSLVTCSRDTFKDGTFFTSTQILKIARGIASATMQLHKRGLMHGDLYAHNILVDNNANSLMGDFGAASFYDPQELSAMALQRIETRAFGCLLDDLLMNGLPMDSSLPLTLALRGLRDECMRETTGERPLFDEIVRRLDALH